MSAFDAHLAEQLDRLVPETTVVGDWQAVVTAAKRQRRRRRIVQLATALAVFATGVSPVGGAVAHRLGDFSAWLRGVPGTPASQSDQQAFDRANARSWAGFPPGTELRSLIKTEVGGHQFELFGFHSGDSLCLRLIARGFNGNPALSCAPLASLRTAAAPVLVLQSDHGFGLPTTVPTGGYVAPQAQASFGIAADGVRRVDLMTDDGERTATLASNAFLYVADKPTLGSRVRDVFAIGSNGAKMPVPFQPAPFGDHNPVVPTHHDATGPVRVERAVDGGTIGWLVRREDRGQAPPNAASHLIGVKFEFARLLTPDPESHDRILVGIGAPRFGAQAGKRSVCTLRIARGSAGGGCSSFQAMFSLAPFTLAQSTDEGGDQYATLSGIASDDVALMQLFLGTGETRPIPLHDNAWLAQVARADYPVRVVAYDRDNRIIGIQTLDTP